MVVARPETEKNEAGDKRSADAKGALGEPAARCHLAREGAPASDVDAFPILQQVS